MSEMNRAMKRPRSKLWVTGLWIIVLLIMAVLAYAWIDARVSLEYARQEQRTREKPPEIGRIEALKMYFNRTDGALVFPAVKILHDELIGDPLQWYEVMSKDSASFNHFLHSLGSAVFKTVDSAEVEQLEEIRLSDLERLRSIEIPKKYMAIHKRVIDRLEGITPSAYQ